MRAVPGEGFRRGVRLAIDWGKARIGLAACDPDGMLAHPVGTVPAGPAAMAELIRLVHEYAPIEVVVGYPRSLDGREGIAAAAITQSAVELAGRIAPTPVCLVDERLSTVVATRRLKQAGRRARQQRAIIDQAAAVAILDHALDLERSTGRPPGSRVGEGLDDERNRE